MLSKKEIEKAKERIRNSLNDIGFATLYSQEENDEDEKTLLQYIDQLEEENKQLKIAYKLMENEAMKDGLEERKKQNKIIDEATTILEELKICHFKKKDGGELLGKYRCYNKEDWKQYFEKKVEEK